MNCSQVAMFQIMPVLCPHREGEGRGGEGRGGGEGGQPNGQDWTGGGGSQNLWGHPLWMTPKRKEMLVIGLS